MAREDLGSVLDIVNYAERILASMDGKVLADLAGDLDLADATLYRFAIIGEAAKRLSDTFRVAHPDINWKGVAGFRDVVIHDYDAIDWEIVLRIVADDLPRLTAELKPLLPRETD
jgi:uncharacterized protein with HEPN domain